MARSSRPLRTHPITLRTTQVAEVFDVSPSVRRVILEGDELAAGVDALGNPRPAFLSSGFDDHVKLVIPDPSKPTPHIGTPRDYGFTWNPDIFAQTRDYTVRAFDPEAQRLTLDFVRHSEGLAAEWVERCAPGDAISFAGPKTCHELPPDIDTFLLLADETALPAVARFLEEATADIHVIAIIEIPSASDQQIFQTDCNVELTWLVRDDASAGFSTRLLEHLRSVVLPQGRTFAWCAGEAVTVTPIRRYLRNDLGLPKEDVDVAGYWRRPAADNQISRAAALHALEELGDLSAALIVRVAATVDVPATIASGHTLLADIARETECRPTMLRSLLDAMCAIGLTHRDGDHYRNTTIGALLAEEEAATPYVLNTERTLPELSLLGLIDRLRPPTQQNDDPAEMLQYSIDPLWQLEQVQEASSFLAVGRGADFLMEQFRALDPERSYRSATTIQSSDSADVVILLSAFGHHEEGAAVEMARSGLAVARQHLIVLENTRDNAATDDHTALDDLRSICETGLPLPTSSTILDGLGRAGATTPHAIDLGWGFAGYKGAFTARV